MLPPSLKLNALIGPDPPEAVSLPRVLDCRDSTPQITHHPPPNKTFACTFEPKHRGFPLRCLDRLRSVQGHDWASGFHLHRLTPPKMREHCIMKPRGNPMRQITKSAQTAGAAQRWIYRRFPFALGRHLRPQKWVDPPFAWRGFSNSVYMYRWLQYRDADSAVNLHPSRPAAASQLGCQALISAYLVSYTRVPVSI